MSQDAGNNCSKIYGIQLPLVTILILIARKQGAHEYLRERDKRSDCICTMALTKPSYECGIMIAKVDVSRECRPRSTEVKTIGQNHNAINTTYIQT